MLSAHDEGEGATDFAALTTSSPLPVPILRSTIATSGPCVSNIRIPPPNVRRLPNHLKASVVAKHLQHAYPCHFVVVYVKATARAGIEAIRSKTRRKMSWSRRFDR